MTTTDLSSIIDRPVLATMADSTVEIINFSEDGITARWGESYLAPEAQAPIVINGIGSKGYMRLKFHPGGTWGYDGGGVYRSEGWMVDITDSMRSKLIDAFAELALNLPTQVRREIVLKEAARALQRARDNETDAEAKLLEAQTTRQAASTAYSKALNEAIMQPAETS